MRFNSIALKTKDQSGLKAYFNRVYNYMAGGLALSGIVAWLSTQGAFLRAFYSVSPTGQVSYSLLGWIAVFSPFILIFMISSALKQLNIPKAQTLFWGFSALMGVSMGNIFFLFSGSTIFQAFLVTSGMFLAMSLYGYTTQKSLANWGSFLIMGLFGVILVSIVNLFFHSGALAWATSIIAVVIFVGLTAYDTQRLKDIYNGADSVSLQQAKALSGALALYLDFINLFQLVLHFMNDRR